MAVRTQLFAGTHADALARCEALDAAREPVSAPHVDLPGIDPYDLEQLGEIAARAVRFGSGDLEPVEVDLDHESLLALPDFWCEVLAELEESEDPEAPADVAREWAASEDMTRPEHELAPIVRAVVDLVTTARDDGLDVFCWSEQD